MLWFNANRQQIKADNPELSLTEVAKKGGELWSKLGDKSEWDKKASEAKERYEEAMAEYRKSGGGASVSTESSSKKSKPKSTPKKDSASTSAAPGSAAFKSKEFISDSSSEGKNADLKQPSVVRLMTITGWCYK